MSLILGEHIEVKSVQMERGGLRIAYDQDAKANYDIFTADASNETTTTEDSDFSILLEDAQFSEIGLFYEDALSQQTAAVFVDAASFSGAFSSTKFNLTSTATLQSQFVALQQDTFLVRKAIDYDAVIAVDLEAGKYTFDRVVASVEGNSFKLDGSITSAARHTDFDILVQNNDGDLAGVLQLLPKSYAALLGDFSSRGRFQLEAFVNGRQSKAQQPSVAVQFQLEDGRINSPRLGSPLKEVYLDVQYKSGLRSSLNIQQLKGAFNGQTIALQAQLQNLDDPDIDLRLDGTLPLRPISGLLYDFGLQDAKGTVGLNNIQLQGKYSDMQNPSRINRVKASGEVQLNRTQLKLNEQWIRLDKGDLELAANNWYMRDVQIRGASSEIYLDGYFRNVLPVVLADSTNSQNAYLQFDADLHATRLDLDRLAELSMSPVEEYEVGAAAYDSIRVAEASQREAFTNFLDGRFNAKIGALNYHRLEAEDFTGNLEFQRNQLLIQGQANAMQGKLNVDGTLYFEQQPRLKARLHTHGVRMEEFLYQSENFGQDYLTDQQLHGNMDSKIAIYAFWDEQMNFDYDRLKVLAEIGIKEGELIDFELFKYFSTYIKLKDLEHVRFSNLVNWLEI
ncbi:MAG: hypothetical protein AAF738_09655, partial [Bacteroidota bacterium]